MSFGVQDFNDLIQLLDERPDWQAALRSRLLTNDFLRLPSAVDSLIVAQQRTDQQIQQLVAAQQRTEQRLEILAGRVDDLAAAQQRTEQRLGELAQSVQQLTATVRPMVPQLGEVRGLFFEIRYERRARIYLSRFLRDAQNADLVEMVPQLESRLTLDEIDDVNEADLVVSGRPRRADLPSPTYVVIEVSAVIDAHDVERARRRADLLNRAGFAAIPAVAGERTAEGLTEALRDHGAVLMLGGKVERWDDAANAFLRAA